MVQVTVTVLRTASGAGGLGACVGEGGDNSKRIRLRKSYALSKNIIEVSFKSVYPLLKVVHITHWTFSLSRDTWMCE